MHYCALLNNGESYNSPEKWELRLQQDNAFDSMKFVDAMHEIVNLSIDEALSHKNPYVRALALVDKRFGTRRLKEFRYGRDAFPIVKMFYRLRAGKELLPWQGPYKKPKAI